MNCKYVVGSGALLEWAMHSWAEAEPQLELIALEVRQDAQHFFDVDIFDNLRSPAEATAFVAWSEQFLNFRRLELMGLFKARGYRMPALRCRSAIIASNATIAENASVGAGAIVGAGCRIGMNAHIGQGAMLGLGVQIGNCAWVADGVQMGAAAKLGAHSTLGMGVVVAGGVAIGRQSIVDKPGRVTESVADKTYRLARLEREVRIVDYRH